MIIVREENDVDDVVAEKEATKGREKMMLKILKLF